MSTPRIRIISKRTEEIVSTKLPLCPLSFEKEGDNSAPFHLSLCFFRTAYVDSYTSQLCGPPACSRAFKCPRCEKRQRRPEHRSKIDLLYSKAAARVMFCSGAERPFAFIAFVISPEFRTPYTEYSYRYYVPVRTHFVKKRSSAGHTHYRNHKYCKISFPRR